MATMTQADWNAWAEWALGADDPVDWILWAGWLLEDPELDDESRGKLLAARELKLRELPFSPATEETVH